MLLLLKYLLHGRSWLSYVFLYITREVKEKDLYGRKEKERNSVKKVFDAVKRTSVSYGTLHAEMWSIVGEKLFLNSDAGTKRLTFTKRNVEG